MRKKEKKKDRRKDGRNERRKGRRESFFLYNSNTDAKTAKNELGKCNGKRGKVLNAAEEQKEVPNKRKGTTWSWGGRLSIIKMSVLSMLN